MLVPVMSRGAKHARDRIIIIRVDGPEAVVNDIDDVVRGRAAERNCDTRNCSRVRLSPVRSMWRPAWKSNDA